MSTTLLIESFSEPNLRERTVLTVGAAAGVSTLTVQSTQGLEAGDFVYVGQLSREGCEKARVSAVPDYTTITLAEPLKLAHSRFEPLVSVLGDLIHIYRAPNVNGQVPALDQFTVLATREIDPDQTSTYFTDSSGDSQFWYGYTYFNATTNQETDLQESSLRRGDDFGHYASVSEIRRDAGFEGAVNLSDVDIDAQRRAAESEINATLGTKYTVPFDPVPEMVHTLTVQLGAALLWDRYLKGTTKGRDALKEVRARILSYATDQNLVGDDGQSIGTGAISYWPDDTAYRAFTMEDRF